MPIKCPSCQKSILWHWEQDAYVIIENTNLLVLSASVEMTTIVPDVEVHAHFCTCGKILGFSVVDEDGETTYDNPMLNGHDTIYWESKENSYDDSMGPLTPIKELSKI